MLTRDNFLILLNNNWLNDEILDFFTSYHIGKEGSTVEYLNCCDFSSMINSIQQNRTIKKKKQTKKQEKKMRRSCGFSQLGEPSLGNDWVSC